MKMEKEEKDLKEKDLKEKDLKEVALDSDGYDRNHHTIDLTHWYYEEPAGIEIYEHGIGRICRIGWNSLRESIRRKDKAMKRVKK